MQSLYTAASGLTSQQLRLDTIAANISNANTPGFKATRVDFKDALYHTMVDPEPSDAPADNLACGSGVLLDATNIDMNQGAIEETGITLDFAIEGDGFFQVQDENGQILYTRSGSFTTTNDGSGNYLVTPEGYYVLDADGNRLKLPESVTNLTVYENGVIRVDGQEYGALGVVGFANADGLAPAGGTCYTETVSSGPSLADSGSKIVQGSLERSNVDMSQELTLLIRSQRAYALASRAVTTTDDMMGLANNLHG
jgi:flagellar basal-body rod protein FlgG